MKLATYPFQKYESMEGTVKTVFTDASTQEKTSGDEDQSSSATQMPFKAIIELAAQHLKVEDGALPLAAGMQLTAEIIEDDRTVLEYLLSPVQHIASEAGRER